MADTKWRDQQFKEPIAASLSFQTPQLTATHTFIEYHSFLIIKHPEEGRKEGRRPWSCQRS